MTWLKITSAPGDTRTHTFTHIDTYISDPPCGTRVALGGRGGLRQSVCTGVYVSLHRERKGNGEGRGCRERERERKIGWRRRN